MRKSEERAASIAAGLPRYFTGKPCKNGHISERFTSSKTCCTCSLEVSRTPKRKPQEVAYRERTSVRRKKTWAKYHALNRAGRLAYLAKWRTQNVVKFRQGIQDWNARNPEKKSGYRLTRRKGVAERQAAWGIELTRFVFAEAITLCALREECTGFAWHVDHMVPLLGRGVSGLHVWNNLEVIPAYVNLRKSNSGVHLSPLDWLRGQCGAD